MLVTSCKHCGARFRVNPEQLNLRQGQVRCGQCGQTFNGFEALERFPGGDAGTPTPPAAPILPPREADVLEPLAQDDIDSVTPTGREARRPEAPREHVPTLPPPSVGHHVPGPSSRPARAWVFAAATLAIILGLQLAYAFRAKLAQQYPGLRPALESACTIAGCTVPWANDESALKLEESELLEVPGKPGQIALQARIRNLSPAAQEFPHLQLTLTDATGQTVIRRVLRPADYIGRAPAPGEIMAAGSEAILSIRFETGHIKPTGYELLIFHP